MSVRPLYGPVSGGTRLTITGLQFLNVSAVYIGQRRAFIDTQRSVHGSDGFTATE